MSSQSAITSNILQQDPDSLLARLFLQGAAQDPWNRLQAPLRGEAPPMSTSLTAHLQVRSASH